MGKSGVEPGPKGRHREIVDAAAKLFQEKGYEGTSLQDIAREVGLLKGSMYHYIDSKEDLLYSIIQESHAGALALIDEVSRLDEGALIKIYSLVKKHVDVFARDSLKHSVFFREFRALSPERGGVIRGAGHAYSLFLRTLMSQGQDQGLLAPDLDPKMATTAAMGMLNAMAFWYHAGGPWTSEEIGTEFARMVVMGLVDEDYLREVGGRAALIKHIEDSLTESVG